VSAVDEITQEAPEQIDTPEERQPELIEVLTPMREPKRWVFIDKREIINAQTGEPEIHEIGKYVFVQRPLSYFRKLEFLKTVSDAVKELMEGPDGLSFQEVVDMLSQITPTGPGGSITPEMLADGETIVKLITKLGAEAPGLMLDLYALFLNVPAEEKPIFRELVSRPVDLGGLSDNDGIEIMEIFVDQNVDVMRDFFKQLGRLGRRANQRLRDGGSAPSKP